MLNVLFAWPSLPKRLGRPGDWPVSLWAGRVGMCGVVVQNGHIYSEGHFVDNIHGYVHLGGYSVFVRVYV